jgi:hypothetical protein
MYENGACVVENSENSKIGVMATTYAASKTCPDSCPFKKTNSCYGRTGPINHVRVDLCDKFARKSTALDVAKAEAKLIDKLSGLHLLRLHSLGDCKDTASAKVLAAAAKRYTAKFCQSVFSFTHAWREIPRHAWGSISILASCETAAEVQQAQALGYATAIVVSEHRQLTAYVHDGVKVIPCPQQTKKVPHCTHCGLCLKDKMLLKTKQSIAFHPHGPSLKAKAMLERKGVK